MTTLGWIVLLLTIVPVVWLWAYAIGDLLKRRDISTWRRGLWIVGVLALPLVGGLLDLIFRPSREDDIRGFGRRPARRPTNPTAPPDDGEV